MNLPTKTSLIVLAALPVFGSTAVAGPLGIFWTMDTPHRMELFIDHGAVTASEKHGTGAAPLVIVSPNGHWEVEIAITILNAPGGGADGVGLDGRVRHLTGPHGEGVGDWRDFSGVFNAIAAPPIAVGGVVLHLGGIFIHSDTYTERYSWNGAPANPNQMTGFQIRLIGEHPCPPVGGGGICLFAGTFDDEQPGIPVSWLDGWEIWCQGGDDAFVSDEVARSPSNSVQLQPFSDVVRTLEGFDSGRWVFSAWTYVPEWSLGDGYVILMNTYCDGPDEQMNWSMQVRLSPGEGIVESQWDGHQLPLLFDTWVEIRAEIDLDNDRFDVYYGDLLLASDLVWGQNVTPGSALGIAALNLYSEGVFFVDDILLEPAVDACPLDINGDGAINVLDMIEVLLCFGLPASPGCEAQDINNDGTVNVLDLIELLLAFGQACP